jgi:excisionase family DNA binding protein
MMVSTMEQTAVVVPMPEESSVAQAALGKVGSALRAKRSVKLQLGDNQGEVEVPYSALTALNRALASVAAGEPFGIISANAELTTQQAADLLNVSRPYIIKLLDSGEIEYRKVGTHRRVLAASLMHYMHEDDKKRRAAVDALSAELSEMGFVQ